MKLKRSIAALLLAVLLTSAVSCSPHTGIPDDSTQTNETTVENESTDNIVENELTLYDGADNIFRIVTATSPTDSERSFAEELAAKARSVFKVKPETVTDKHADESYSCEVVVGYTSLAGSDEAFSSMSYGQACIRVIGNRIFAVAFSEDGYGELMLHIQKLIGNNKKDGSLVLKSSQLEYTVSLEPYLIYVPTVGGCGLPTTVDCGINQTFFLYENASAEAFDNYVSKVGSEKIVSTSTVGGNKFATFDISSGILNVSFTKSDNSLRIIYEGNRRPTELFAPVDEVKAVCEPQIIMRGMSWRDENNENKINGLCIIIRLSDGRFIIVDGGWDRQRDADDLYKLLKDNTPEGMKITVAAWIITHAHEDHHSVFAFDFPSTYKNLVAVENVIFNPPAEGFYTGTNISGHAGNEREVLAGIHQFNARLVRPHVGDRYFIGDAVIDVIYTIDMHYPEQFDYYNTCSLMLSISIAGEKIMITGDASNVAFGIAVRVFGRELKSDIVQVAHHGYGTGVAADKSTDIARGYTLMAPSLLLWPSSQSGYQSGLKSVYNITLIRLPTIKRIIVAGEKDHVIHLPYDQE